VRLRLAIVIGAALATALLVAGPAAQGAVAQGAVAQGGIGVVLPPPDICLTAVCVDVSVSVTGNGSGRVTSSPAGIDCVVSAAEGESVQADTQTGTCSHRFTSDTRPLTVRFGVTPDPGSFCDPCTHEVVAEQSLDVVVPVGLFPLPGGAGGANGAGHDGAGAPAQADATVEAELIDVSAFVKGPRKEPQVLVSVELRLEEAVSASVRLVRKDTTLRSRQFSDLQPGERLLTLRYGKLALAPTRATLVLELTDAGGNTLVLARRVQLRPQARAAAVVGRAGASGAVCGTFQAGGATWGAKTTGVSCATARRIVRKLAAVTAPLPSGRYPGRYAGMTCGGLVPGSKPRIITCQGDGRQIVAGRKP
jgi:hypothetical protein